MDKVKVENCHCCLWPKNQYP